MTIVPADAIAAGADLRELGRMRMVAPMGKGFEENRNRVAELASFGKDLARRARSKCELCETGGVPLQVFEVPPREKFPRVEHCAFLCESCSRQIEEERHFVADEQWRCVAKTVWSEIPAVQVLALRVLRRLQKSQAWAQDTLEEVFVDAEVEAWADEAK